MKQGPSYHRVEENMRFGSLAVYGFLGRDPRSLQDIIREDALTLERLGLTAQELAERMRFFTAVGRKQLGAAVVVDGCYAVQTQQHKGTIPCPFAHNHQESKDITTVTHLLTKKTARWSDLNIHLIAEHGFFEGRGAEFRIEPNELADILGLGPGGGE